MVYNTNINLLNYKPYEFKKVINYNNDNTIVLKIKLRKFNKSYEMICQYCKSKNVILHDIYELQKCLNCNMQYIPNIEKLK